MLRAIDNYFSSKEEPFKSYLLALREIVLSHHREITEAWKYGMPFYYYKGKMFCYLWIHKKLQQPYIGIVVGDRLNHPKLIQEKRARMKIMLFDPDKNIPIKTVHKILKEARTHY